MASGSSGRANSGSKGFDFGTDDILCSYDDYANQDSSNGSHSDPTTGDTNPTKQDFHKIRMARPSIFPSGSYSPPDDSFNHDMTATVEKIMKKYTDNLMRFLEGISSRLSQLELYCYNLDKSIKEMRSDLVLDNGEADTKLKSLEKHLQEVHRSVQILRDKQELAETQKELAKLQTGQKESSSLNHSQSSEERVSTPKSDPNKTDNTSDMQNQQLALALPHEVAPPHQQPVAPPPQPQVHPQNMSQQQQQSYYMPQTQLPTPQAPAPTQHAQNQYLSSDPHYRSTQLQDLPRGTSQPTHSPVNQAPAAQTYSQYPQQWPQQQMQQPQQPSSQQQMRPPAPSSYPPYPPTQPTNQPPVEALPNNIPAHMSFSVPQPLSNRSDGVPYGYNSPGRTVTQQHPPQQIKNTYGTQPGDGYAVTGPHPALPPGSSYMIYDNEGGRTHHPPPQPHFLQSGYPPTNAAIQNQQLPANIARNPNHPQLPRNHPYSELTDKLMSMGFRGDHVASVIQRMEDSGQPVDFNSVLDRLDAHSSGGSQNQRAW